MERLQTSNAGDDEMTDRELLELAAKAAGLEVVTPTMLKYGQWNPLTDDGDALRLAVGLKIRFEKTDTFAVAWGAEKQFTEPLTNDPYAATRRAITRAAAEIGKAML
jgi:hypothetical protein